MIGFNSILLKIYYINGFNLATCRLYTYFTVKTKNMYEITIGYANLVLFCLLKGLKQQVDGSVVLSLWRLLLQVYGRISMV